MQEIKWRSQARRGNSQVKRWESVKWRSYIEKGNRLGVRALSQLLCAGHLSADQCMTTMWRLGHEETDMGLSRGARVLAQCHYANKKGGEFEFGFMGIVPTSLLAPVPETLTLKLADKRALVGHPCTQLRLCAGV